MIKKFGLVTVTVTAGLLAAAPFASATTTHHDGGHSAPSCDFTGGTGEGSRSGDANGDIAAVTGATAGGAGGSNVGNIADCSSFLNDNVNGNDVVSGNDVDLGSGELRS